MAKGILSGIAGEALVVSQISKSGHIATFTSKNTPNFDVLATNLTGTKFVAIQVKTSSDGKKFVLSQKDEQWACSGSDVLYALVDLKNEEIFYVLASEVSLIISTHHKSRVANGVKDNPMREIYKAKISHVKPNDISILGL